MELYAVKYGEDFKYATYNTIYRGNNSEEIVPGFIFLYYIAIYDDKTILFDTGFRSQETATGYGVKLIDVEQEVKNLIKDKIDMIFITHAHFDHTDNLDLYPDTDIIISKDELEEASKKYSDAVGQILKTNRIHIIEDEYIYDNKFRFKVIGGHTKGSSVIYFENDGKQYVITGDEVYYCDNILKNIPNGNVCDADKNEKFILDTYQNQLIALPYHDSKIFQDYQSVSPNIVHII